MPASGTIALLSQPPGQICAVLGDILATRLKVRGIKGVVVDGRVRDISALGELGQTAAEGETGNSAAGFQIWSRATSTVGTGLEAKAWLADAPLTVGGTEIRSGDVLVADLAERGCVVVPAGKLGEVVEMLPRLRDADEAVVRDVKAGVDVTEAFRRHR